MHDMPFGAQLLSDGVRFRLWAPACEVLQIAIEGLPNAVKMHAQAGGWHELMTRQAHAGSRYRFTLSDGTHIPDPASRFQPDDVHGPSEVIDPTHYRWTTKACR